MCLIGFESHPETREALVPGDGPSTWTSGTLFPQPSKKVARAINTASANRPVVVLASLSGFDGFPESMRLMIFLSGARRSVVVTGRARVRLSNERQCQTAGRGRGKVWLKLPVGSMTSA